MSKTNIYVLRLEGGRYYIGKTNDVMKRYEQHLTGGGSAWTRKYKPVSLEKAIENVSPFDEDKITKEYMSKYGIDKVRGGSYVEEELSEFHKDVLNMEIWAAKDLCTQCGRAGHFVKDCYAKTDASGNKIEFEKTSKGKNTKNQCMKSSTNAKESACYRCGRPGHYSADCYAGRHQKGYTLDSDCETDDETDCEADDETDYESDDYSD
jgi:predicted GIY-YIG superfamily endonuclease